jgi:predicted ATPase
MTLDLRPLNILIGANGAGKSNIIAFFKLVNELMGGRLQQHVGATGGASANLHFGPKITPQLEAELAFEADNGTDTYRMRLFHAAGDTLIFAEEMLSFQQTGYWRPKEVQLGAGHRETWIVDEAAREEPVAKTLRYLLNHCRVYHFHDTSPTSGVRQHCYASDSRWLMPDAANLAAVLYQLKMDNEAIYRRVVGAIRQVAPFFGDFDLEPTAAQQIILNWRHRSSDRVFGPHQLSDGTLRAICLIALLSQPKENLPILIVVDEPELGLHPYALNVMGSLFQAASHHTQILVSTQSSTLVDGFEPQDIVVVERDDKDEATEFCRPDTEKLAEWLEDYSLGEVWEKNVIGGGPH